MLIQCPECHRQISDKAQFCPQCGYTIGKDKINKVCTINNIQYNLDEAFNFSKNGKYKESFIVIRNITQLSIKNCLNILEYIKVLDAIPEEYIIKDYSKEEEKDAATIIFSMKDDKAKIASSKICPKCGSTEFTPLRRKWSLLAGFATNKIDMVCSKCGTVVK